MMLQERGEFGVGTIIRMYKTMNTKSVSSRQHHFMTTQVHGKMLN